MKAKHKYLIISMSQFKLDPSKLCHHLPFICKAIKTVRFSLLLASICSFHMLPPLYLLQSPL